MYQSWSNVRFRAAVDPRLADIEPYVYGDVSPEVTCAAGPKGDVFIGFKRTDPRKFGVMSLTTKVYAFDDGAACISCGHTKPDLAAPRSCEVERVLGKNIVLVTPPNSDPGPGMRPLDYNQHIERCAILSNGRLRSQVQVEIRDPDCPLYPATIVAAP